MFRPLTKKIMHDCFVKELENKETKLALFLSNFFNSFEFHLTNYLLTSKMHWSRKLHDIFYTLNWHFFFNSYKRSITDLFAECNLRNSRHLKLNGISLADRQKFMPTHQSRPSSRNSNCSDSHCKEFVNYNSNAISDVFDDSDDEADNERYGVKNYYDCSSVQGWRHKKSLGTAVACDKIYDIQIMHHCLDSDASWTILKNLEFEKSDIVNFYSSCIQTILRHPFQIMKPPSIR